MEAHLHREEEESNFLHVSGSAKLYVVDENDLSAKDIDVERSVCDEHSMANVSTIECKLRHALDGLDGEHEGNPLQLSILPFVGVDGSKMYNSTLVSKLNGNPTLSKDWLARLNFRTLYVKPKVSLPRARDNCYTLKLGCDYVVLLVS